MGIIYNIAFIIFAIFYIPVFIFKKKKRQGMRMRLGLYPAKLIKELSKKKNIWVHAVSIGEVMAVSPLISMLRKEYPDYRLVITTVTESGNKVAKKLAQEGEIVLFLPFDITSAVKRVISYIRPHLMIIAETELWPNLIRSCAKNNISMVIVNGRISDKSFKRYSIIRFMLKPLFKKIKLFLMQSEFDRDRIAYLGADSSKIKVTGSMKFDSALTIILSDDDKAKLRSALNLKASERLFIAGSTNPGEEEIILSAYKTLKREFDNLKLLIAPRHIERTPEIERLISESDFTPVRFSQRTTDNGKRTTKHIFILDTIGQLKSLYSIADVVFVGGSLIKKGGQNILEPAIFAKPIIFGPHMFNFRDIAELFLKDGAAIMVEDADSIKRSVGAILKDDSLRNSLCQKSREIVEKNRGATALTLKEIRPLL
jgi:3-deoxy-D-manno-octulosonic-acid transferase